MKIIKLTLIFLKNSYIGEFFNKEENKNRNRALISLLLLITVTLGFVSSELIEGLMSVGQETLFLGIFLIIIAFFSLFQAIFSSLSLLYFSKDVEQILPLPLKPYQILIAKFNSLLVTEYVIELVIGFIPLVLYGSLTSASSIFYVYLLIIFLVFPIIPIIISAFLIILIMSFARFSKNRDSFQFITGIISTIILSVCIFAYMNHSTPYSEPSNQDEIYEIEDLTYQQDNISEVPEDIIYLVDSTTRYFPTIKIGINILSNPTDLIGFLNLIWLITFTILSYIIFILVGNKLYLVGVVGNTEQGSNRYKAKINPKDYKSKNIGHAYILKEFKLLFRNPIYVLQCVFPVLFVPIMFILTVSYSLNSDMGAQLLDELRTVELYNINFAITILVIVQILFSFSYITITAISRDGQDAKFVKYIPVSLYNQFIYKLIPGILVNIFGITITLSVLFYLFPWISLVYIFILFLISSLINILQNCLFLIIDLKNPKLNWNSEYSVIKQNMNILYQYIILLVFIMVFVYFVRNYLKTVDIYFSLLILASIIGILTILVNLYVIKHEERLFSKIN